MTFTEMIYSSELYYTDAEFVDIASGADFPVLAFLVDKVATFDELPLCFYEKVCSRVRGEGWDVDLENGVDFLYSALLKISEFLMAESDICFLNSFLAVSYAEYLMENDL